ncbi:MAG: CHAD domain-containing protein, partial [Methyloprofundus sp.]|nr:CHAD domain-containing protein [Methyloprofundus sp.]
AEALHDLRKTCKKLRYLMEFFQSLYPATEFKTVLKALKGFQSVLGDFQDYEIQEENLKQFSEEMMDEGVASNTFLAMGVLVQHLDSMRRAARDDFSEQFDLFKQTKNQQTFKRLFAHKA